MGANLALASDLVKHEITWPNPTTFRPARLGKSPPALGILCFFCRVALLRKREQAAFSTGEARVRHRRLSTLSRDQLFQASAESSSRVTVSLTSSGCLREPISSCPIVSASWTTWKRMYSFSTYETVERRPSLDGTAQDTRQECVRPASGVAGTCRRGAPSSEVLG